jgi:putative membrane protein
MTIPALPLDTGTRLAIERTRLAYERNMMAWIRTATGLISFGFTIYKFFDFESGRALPGANGRLLSPRLFALIMIGTGLIALLLGTIEHRRSITELQAERGVTRPSVAGVLAGFIALLGLLALFDTLFRGWPRQ